MGDMRTTSFLLISLPVAVLLSLASCSRARPAPPRPEHPRPDFERTQWLNLNGQWEFRFDSKDLGLDQNWQNPNTPFDREITVPFCWESKLSGVHDLSGHQIGWYRRKITVPAEWSSRRVWLRFEAVDWEARVWVNGQEVGRHEGGYTPFAFDITDQVKPGESATIVVRAYDPTDRELPTGKQIVFWYTFTSGIWQTVWLEARPETYLDSLKLVPRHGPDGWSLAVEAAVAGSDGAAHVRLASPDETVSPAEGDVELRDGRGTFQAELKISDPKLWSPKDPHLYDLNVQVTGPGGEADTVKSYFGLRTIERGRYGDLPYESVLLNGEPIYLRGALDQSFNPDGIYTAPSDEFLRKDMELAKSLGLNFLRIHIKPDEPRRLYWADRVGVMIMEDMPNTWEYSERAKKAWEATMREVIARDRNHPAIFSWVLFNETWGLGSRRTGFRDYAKRPEIQQWVRGVWEEVKRTDPTRLVEDNSPNKRDHVVTDINSWHFYIDDYQRARKHIEEVVKNTYPGSPFNFVPGARQGTAPLMNSEYGAVSAGGGDRDISWGFRYLTTQLRRHEKIQGYVYTELTDIEFEHNGFVNYDRSPKEFGYDTFVEGMTVADLQGDDFVGFDAPPAILAEPGTELRIPAFVSHFSDREGEIMLRRWLIGVDDLGREIRVNLDSKPVRWERYRVTEQPPLEVTLPDRPFAGAMAMELADEQGRRIAANFVNVVTRRGVSKSSRGQRSPRLERLDARRVAIRLTPREVAAARWTGSGVMRRPGRAAVEKLTIRGAGWVEYRFPVPQPVIEANPTRLGLFLELATRARDERLDWPQLLNPLDQPQTDGKKLPGTVNIIINGNRLEPVELADDPADARGVLSHLSRVDPGSYGYLVRGEIYLQGLPEFVSRLRQNPMVRIVLEVPEGEHASGLSVYGERTGRYATDPTLVLETERDIVWPNGQPES